MKKFILFLLVCFGFVDGFAQNDQVLREISRLEGEIPPVRDDLDSDPDILVIREINLFDRVNGDIISNPSYININIQKPQPSSIPSSSNMYHNFQVQSLYYNWQVNIMGQEGIPESASHYYEYFDIINNNGTVIFRTCGQDLLATTKELTLNKNRNNYFEKIPLDNNSYALVFCGMRDSYSDVPGEMMIVVVNKNQAVLVYDDYAAAITPTDFDSDSFTMYFLKDLSGLYNPSIEDYDVSPVNLGSRRFYRLRKVNGVLKIALCRYVY